MSDEKPRINLRPEVQLFAEAMELRLRKYDQERGVRGWADALPFGLLGPLLGKESELYHAMRGASEEPGASMDPKLVLSKAADLANFAMMIADVTGGLKAGLVPSEAEVNATITEMAFHPNGRCECCGEGRCSWCQRIQAEGGA